MPYSVGIDLGTTFTAAAVLRAEAARPDVFTLGTRSSTIPSTIAVLDDGTTVFGEIAEQRSLSDPDRLARQFKRRLGDPAPVFVAGSPWSAEALIALLLRGVLDRVATEQGAWPSEVVLTHPASWGTFKLDLLTQAARLTDLNVAFSYVSEPVAAASYYGSTARVADGAIVAVYDLGGGTFDAAVLRKSGSEFVVLGQPEGVERLGGIDFDAAVFEHVRSAMPDAFAAIDEDDSIAMAAVAQVRESCVRAKETLSADTQATISVLLPTESAQLRITRSEFEELIRPQLDQSVDAMGRALRSAGVSNTEVDRILLVGGSSRIPLVAQLVSSAFGRPVAVDANPKNAIALGATLSHSTPARPPDTASDPVPVVPATTGPDASAPTSDERLADAPREVLTPVDDVGTPPIGSPTTTKRAAPRRRVVVTAVATLLVIAVAAIVLLRPSSGEGGIAVTHGTQIVLTADASASTSEVNTTAAAIRRRIAPSLIANDSLTVSVSGSNIVVDAMRHPNDPNNTIAGLVSSAGNLTFRPITERQQSGTCAAGSSLALTDSGALPFTDTSQGCAAVGPGIGGQLVQSAKTTNNNSQPGVEITLTGTALGLFNNLAQHCFNKDQQCPDGGIAIVVDDNILSAPLVQTPHFDTPLVEVTGNFTQTQVDEFAAALSSGPLATTVRLDANRTADYHVLQPTKTGSQGFAASFTGDPAQIDSILDGVSSLGPDGTYGDVIANQLTIVVLGTDQESAVQEAIASAAHIDASSITMQPITVPAADTPTTDTSTGTNPTSSSTTPCSSSTASIDTACAEMTIFLKPDASDVQIASIKQQLQADPTVSSIYFVTKAEAEASFSSQSDLTTATPPSDLPASFRVALRTPSAGAQEASRYQHLEGVAQVVTR
jgi:actin-like ATPase involved in cell morphogenesis